MTNKPMLSVERNKFEAFWRATMNVEMMDLHRCEFAMTAYDDQPYACHETDRSWMTWKGRALLDQPVPEPVAVFSVDASGYRAKVILDHAKPFPPDGTLLYAEQPSPVAVVMPDDWEDQLFAEMSRRFDLRKMIDDDHMVYDDTQIGVEFARDWIKARLNGVKP